MNILLWNQDWFASELKLEGHNVLTMGYSSHLDVVLDSPILHIDTALKKIPGGVRPDLLVVHDNSAPIGLDGLETTDIPTIFYSVDTHHHCDLHIELAKVFDATLVAQRDYIPRFEAAGLQAEWFPLWASREVVPRERKEFGAVFVGTLNPRLNPDRVAFFEALGKEVPILCKSGDWATIFDRSELVINQTVKGDLNFRVFEAMGSGALLLTERSPNGLLDLFKEGEHLVTYTKGDVPEAAASIRELLADKDKSRRIAARGRAEIMARHRAEHRAALLMALGRNLTKRPRRGMHFSLMSNFSALGRRLFKVSPALAAHSFAIALKHAEDGLDAGETFVTPSYIGLVSAAIRLDQLMQSDRGHRLLRLFADKFIDLPVINLAVIRGYLNSGRVREAEELSRSRFNTDTQQVYKIAEDVVSSLLDEI